jgi:hypothetical protein
MKVGDPIGESRAQMEEIHGRFSGQTAITVRGPCAYTFKESQNRLDPGRLIHCRDNGQFRCAGIRETDLNPLADSAPYKCLCSVHPVTPLLLTIVHFAYISKTDKPLNSDMIKVSRLLTEVL